MVDQTKMNGGNGRSTRPPLKNTRSAAGNVAHLLHDAVTLAELQFRLFLLDCQQLPAKLSACLVAIAIGLVLALSCVPVALAGIALLLRDGAGLSRVASVWITFGLTVAVAAICIGLGVWRLRHASSFFESSRVEWTQNIERLKEMLRRSSHPNQSQHEFEESYSSSGPRYQ
jgi:Putative Actinobacterial Holin-X, holin superfamily III